MATKVIIDTIRMGYYEEDLDEIEQKFYDKNDAETNTISMMSTALELQELIEKHYFIKLEKGESR